MKMNKVVWVRSPNVSSGDGKRETWTATAFHLTVWWASRCYDAAEGSQQRLPHVPELPTLQQQKLLPSVWYSVVASASSSFSFLSLSPTWSSYSIAFNLLPCLPCTPDLIINARSFQHVNFTELCSSNSSILYMSPTETEQSCSHLSSSLCISLIVLSIQNAQQGFKHINKCQ